MQRLDPLHGRDSRGACALPSALGDRARAAAGDAVAQEALDALRVERMREQEALPAIAALVPQLAQLAGLLDALGEGLDAEPLAQLHEGVDDRGRLRRVPHFGDERAI